MMVDRSDKMKKLGPAEEFLDKRRFTVLFSGGKDSLATLLWVIDNVRHEKWNVLFVEVSGNTHPLNIEYVYNVIDELGLRHRFIHAKREDLDFYKALERWGIPLLHKHRWCMYQFKSKIIKKHAYFTQVTGIKRKDSARRKSIPPIGYLRYAKSMIVNPIFDWTTSKVIKYIKSHGFEINPCYNICGHSGNCMFCPYHSKAQILRTLQLPEWRKRILDVLKSIECNGTLSCYVKKKWLQLANQTTIKVIK